MNNYNSITKNLINATYSELVKWYSLFTESEILTENSEFIKLSGFFTSNVLHQITALTQISEFEYALCPIAKFDPLAGEISVYTDKKINIPNHYLGRNLASICVERYGQSLYPNIAILAQVMFDKDLTPHEEINIMAIFYTIHTSILLFQILLKTCFIKDKGKFNFVNVADRIAIVVRYYTFLNNIMNSSGIKMVGFTNPERTTTEELEFLSKLTGMTNGDINIESIGVVAKSFKDSVE